MGQLSTSVSKRFPHNPDQHHLLLVICYPSLFGGTAWNESQVSKIRSHCVEMFEVLHAGGVFGGVLQIGSQGCKPPAAVPVLLLDVQSSY